MASRTEHYNFDAPADVVWTAVQRAAKQSGWNVGQAYKGALRLNISPRGVCSAATLDVRLFTVTTGTDMAMTASCYGFGFAMNAPLLSYILTLQNMTEVQVNSLMVQVHAAQEAQAARTAQEEQAARQAQAPVPCLGYLDELERLARLRAKGGLTQDEFDSAKRRLFSR